VSDSSATSVKPGRLRARRIARRMSLVSVFKRDLPELLCLRGIRPSEKWCFSQLPVSFTLFGGEPLNTTRRQR
jgi:hypothetical protein